MSQNLDKNKLKEKIQKTPSKDILYLTVNPVDPKSHQSVLKQIERLIRNEKCDVVIIRK